MDYLKLYFLVNWWYYENAYSTFFVKNNLVRREENQIDDKYREEFK